MRAQVPARDTASTVRERQPVAVYTRVSWEDDWTFMPYLVPLSATDCAAPSMPTARFRYDYGTIKRVDASDFVVNDPVWPVGQYVQIRLLTPAGPEVLWTGIITDPEDAPQGYGSSNPEGTAYFTAWGLGHILDQVTLRDARALINGSVQTLGVVPEFNRRSTFGPSSIGNRSTSKSGDGAYVFSADGEVWTNSEIIEYLLAYHQPSTELTFFLDGQTDALDELRMVHRLGGLSLWQCIDHLIPRQRGLVWSIRVNGDFVTILVNTIFGEPISVGDTTIPANTRVHNLDFSTTRNVQEPKVVHRFSSVYDRVIVEGGPVISCFTTSFADSTLEAGWTDAEETAYQEAEDEQRGEDQHARVYTTYRLPRDFDWQVSMAGHNAAPSLYDDGTVDAATSAPQLMFGKAFLRHLPLSKPAAITGAEPELKEPFAAFPVEVDGSWAWVRADAGVDQIELPAMRLRMLDREMGFEVRPRINHILGLDHFSADGVGGLGESFTEPLIDYEEIIATVAVETDLRARVIAYQPGRESVENPRTLTLTVPDAEIWYVAPSTIVDVADGEIVYHTGTNIVRDDSDRLRSVAALALAWYSRKRAAVSFRMETIDSFDEIGAYIPLAFTSDAWQTRVETVLTQVAWDFTTGGTAYATGFQELDVAAIGDVPGMSDSRAVARTIRAQGDAIRVLERRVGNLPVRWGNGGTVATDPEDPETPDVTVGTTAETEAAQTDHWTIGDGTLAKIVLYRMAYSDTGDQKLYGYYRTEKYDAYGRMTSISVETRVTIDTPEACA